MKCGKCGKKIKIGIVKDRKYRWVCVPCSQKLLFERKRGVKSRNTKERN